MFRPKYRRSDLHRELRQHLGAVFRKLALQEESRIEEGHLVADHVDMMISISAKYAVSQVIGFMQGKNAIHLARVYGEEDAKFRGAALLGQGDFVSTVGGDEAIIWEHIRKHEEQDRRLDRLNQLNMWR